MALARRVQTAMDQVGWALLSSFWFDKKGDMSGGRAGAPRADGHGPGGLIESIGSQLMSVWVFG